MSAAETLFDPDRSTFVFICGMKGSGKSTMARALWVSYPYDRLCVDITGDESHGMVGKHPVYAADTKPLEEPIPSRWPMKWNENERQSFLWVPDAGSDTYRDDLDRAVGLVFNHRKSLLWVDEMEDLAPTGRTPPNTRRALRQGRHRDMTWIMCSIRPMGIDPLCLAQADVIYIFEMPNPDDVERVAKSIGWTQKELEAAIVGLPKHGYLRFHRHEEDKDMRLIELPPLPDPRTWARAS